MVFSKRLTFCSTDQFADDSFEWGIPRIRGVHFDVFVDGWFSIFHVYKTLSVHINCVPISVSNFRVDDFHVGPFLHSYWFRVDAVIGVATY